MLRLLLLFVLLSVLLLAHGERYSCRITAPCGCSIKRTIVSKIVGGEVATARSWDWLVSIAYKKNENHFCGGSILSSLWILTAAHCVSNMDASDIIINAGSNRLNQHTQQREVAKILSHPYFNPSTYVNDIALIQLSSPLDIIDHAIAKICLPVQIESMGYDTDSVGREMYTTDEYPPVNSTLVAVGWGRKLEHDASTTNELHQVSIRTIPYESSTCETLVSSPEVQFCAGVEKGDKDTCQGDSGGPLMKFTSSKRWVIAGVTSFGIGCGRAAYSGVYTRVAYYTQWINATMNADDDFAQSISIAYDKSRADHIMDDPLLYERMINICSRYNLSILFYLVIIISISWSLI